MQPIDFSRLHQEQTGSLLNFNWFILFGDLVHGGGKDVDDGPKRLYQDLGLPLHDLPTSPFNKFIDFLFDPTSIDCLLLPQHVNVGVTVEESNKQFGLASNSSYSLDRYESMTLFSLFQFIPSGRSVSASL